MSAFMRIIVIATVAASVLAAPALAEKRTFTVANNPDDYGSDRCLAASAPCGTAAANAYCRARDFVEVLSFRRVDRATPAVAVAASDCPNGRCDALVAIECSR
jgi:hypothetical protein